jgi:hypothetical protein
MLRAAATRMKYATTADTIRQFALTAARRSETIALKWMEAGADLRLEDGRKGEFIRRIGLPVVEYFERRRTVDVGSVFLGQVRPPATLFTIVKAAADLLAGRPRIELWVAAAKSSQAQTLMPVAVPEGLTAERVIDRVTKQQQALAGKTKSQARRVCKVTKQGRRLAL